MTEESRSPVALTAVRGGVGGVLMGLANLVPGISGGTMLLAVGVYPQFIRGVAEISTFRFRKRSLLLLACVVGAALVAIVALAGTVKGLVVDHRWVMYSLFIGLTLGGVPILWAMLRPVGPAAVVAATVGLVVMLALAVAEGTRSGPPGGDPGARTAMLVLAGIAGGSAMILPGVSGGYLLLVLGQYVVILGAIDGAREAVAGRDWAAFGEAMRVFVPVGVGVAVGVVGVSNLVKLCLDKFPTATLGFLLGLLVGAVAGLWPFQAAVAEGSDETAYFNPTVLQALAAIGLVVVGFLASVGISRLGDAHGVRGDRPGAAAGA